ncbi:MAG TPA: ATP synthase F1 subunit epsilon [Pirellulaceae bacterium]|nr:ATP synthase F1 subunit epsilon [Pirellulaceae bacterium]
MADLRCIVVTPETTVVDVPADFVALPLYDGELGVAPGHSPMIGRLGHGELRVKGKNGPQAYYVDGGFVQVADNVVSVLTNRALTPAALDPAEARGLIERAGKMIPNNPEMMALRDRLAAQGRGQLRMIEKR